MYVSCRGTPFKQDLPHLSTMWPREDICRSTMQPTIRAGRSHLPCGRADSHSVGEKSGGSYDLSRRYPAENYLYRIG